MRSGVTASAFDSSGMRLISRFSTVAAQLGAGVVLGLVMMMGMSADYPQAGHQSEEKLANQTSLKPSTTGLVGHSTGSSASAHAAPRPQIKITSAKAGKPAPENTVSKTGAAPAINRKAAKARWDYLDRSLRVQIDAAKITPHRWKMIVIHSSATSSGSAQAFDYYHRNIKHMEHGLAYHFVIGNGQGSGNGRVEIGPRWTAQQAGGHLHSVAQNETAIGICLVGNFEKTAPTKAQLEALDELIDYLQAKVGKVRVTTHRLINTLPTLCPGRKFPAAQFIEP